MDITSCDGLHYNWSRRAWTLQIGDTLYHKCLLHWYGYLYKYLGKWLFSLNVGNVPIFEITISHGNTFRHGFVVRPMAIFYGRLICLYHLHNRQRDLFHGCFVQYTSGCCPQSKSLWRQVNCYQVIHLRSEKFFRPSKCIWRNGHHYAQRGWGW